MYTFSHHYSYLDQLDVAKPGSHIIVRNSRIRMFKGFMRLSVDKWGNITADPEESNFKVLESNNVSEVEYELIRVDEQT